MDFNLRKQSPFSISVRGLKMSLSCEVLFFNLLSCAKAASFTEGLSETQRTAETIAYVMLKSHPPQTLQSSSLESRCPAAPFPKGVQLCSRHRKINPDS